MESGPDECHSKFTDETDQRTGILQNLDCRSTHLFGEADGLRRLALQPRQISGFPRVQEFLELRMESSDFQRSSPLMLLMA